MDTEQITQFAIASGIKGYEYFADDLQKGFLRFAKLVAAHEREQCAKVCDDMGGDCLFGGEFATAIRARKP